MEMIELGDIAEAVLNVFVTTENTEGMLHSWVVARLPEIDEYALVEGEVELVQKGLAQRHDKIEYLELTPAGALAVRQRMPEPDAE